MDLEDLEDQCSVATELESPGLSGDPVSFLCYDQTSLTESNLGEEGVFFSLYFKFMVHHYG